MRLSENSRIESQRRGGIVDSLLDMAGRGSGGVLDADDEHGGGAADVDVRPGLTRAAR